MANLTFKQKQFVKEYIKNKGNGETAALRAYETDDPNVARSIASENLTKPNVQEQLQKELQKSELSLSKFTSRLSEIASEQPAKGYSGADILEAVKTGLKLHGVLSERRMVTKFNINADLSKLSLYELKQLRDKRIKETDSILSESDT